jgi:hypothetical protein
MSNRYVSRNSVQPVRPPIAGTSLWARLRPHIDLQIGSQNQSRFPLKRNTPDHVKREAAALQVSCVFCGQPHNPVRPSFGTDALAVYVTGRRDNGHKHCSYGAESRAAVRWLQEDLGRRDPDEDRSQRDLWESTGEGPSNVRPR